MDPRSKDGDDLYNPDEEYISTPNTHGGWGGGG